MILGREKQQMSTEEQLGENNEVASLASAQTSAPQTYLAPALGLDAHTAPFIQNIPPNPTPTPCPLHPANSYSSPGSIP